VIPLQELAKLSQLTKIVKEESMIVKLIAKKAQTAKLLSVNPPMIPLISYVKENLKNVTITKNVLLINAMSSLENVTTPTLSLLFAQKMDNVQKIPTATNIHSITT